MVFYKEAREVGVKRKAQGVSPGITEFSHASPRSGRQSNEKRDTMFIFSTKDRHPLITLDYQPRLYDYIGGIIRGTGGISLGVDGTEDHVHVLAKLRPDRSLSDVLSDLKCNASGWDVFPRLADFSWQRGYAAFTVSQSHLEDVRRYLSRQKEHHKKVSFRDEFIMFLKANAIEYDERFV